MRLQAVILFLFAILPTNLALQVFYPRPWVPTDPCPTSIKAIILADPCRSSACNRHSFAFTTLDSVHSALLTCPNISSLDIAIHGFYGTWPDRLNLPFSPFGGEKYPNVRSLKLKGYEWDGWSKYDHWTGPKCLGGSRLDCSLDILDWFYKGHWKSWLEWWMQPKEQRNKTNIELWLDAMDWTAIEELSVDWVPESVQKVLSQSQVLRKLNTTDVELIQALPRNSLTHLSFYNGEYTPNLFLDILEKQGESLRGLEICWDDEHLPMSHSGDLDDDFDMLASGTNNLTHLSVNVLRNGTTWPLERIKKIAAIPTLREVDLWMESHSKPHWPCGLGVDEFGIRCEESDRPWGSAVYSTSALRIFNYMREKKQGEEMKKATFWADNRSPEWDEEFPRVKVTCEAKADLDMEDWCVVENDSREPRYWDWEFVDLE